MICPNCKAKCYIERREGGKPFEVYCRSCKTWYDQKSILIPFDPDVDKEETPYDLIKKIQPDILVKGADYKPEEIVGYDIVSEKGGEILTIDLVEGYSTSSILKKL